MNYKISLIGLLCAGSLSSWAQQSPLSQEKAGEMPAFTLTEEDVRMPIDSLSLDVRTSNFPKIKKLKFANIPGGPVLQQPIRIDGYEREIRTEEHGLAYPTLYDWNHDGKPDLLMGEFLTGQSRIKVYLNEGTAKKPKFSGKWFYATDKYGKVISNYQWCCIGIHPQIVDMNGDGIPDIVSGQYYPGVITWWKGTPDGFESGKEIPQLGYQDGKQFSDFGGDEPDWSVEAWSYWNYSSCRFADINGDGLPDLFVAGCGGYRCALNIGTKDEPKFGRREFLFQTDGTILHTWRNPQQVVGPGKFFNTTEVCSGTAHCYLNPIDWDGDGVLDLIITDEYTRSREKGIYFARGVNTQDGIRFEAPIPLFTSEDGSKALPGCCPHVQIVDWNGDGVNDLIMGLSIPTVKGFEGATDLYDKYIGELGLQSPGKDVGESLGYYTLADLNKQIAEQPYMIEYFVGKTSDKRLMTLRHRGFPFVFLGKKPKNKAVAKSVVAAPREFTYDAPYEIPKERTEFLNRRKPVEYNMRAMYDLKYDYHQIEIYFSTQKDFHIYTPSDVNNEVTPLSIEIEWPEGFSADGKMLTPPIKAAGHNEIYDGKRLIFKQYFKLDPSVKPGTYKAKVRVQYQSCSGEMCLPPVNETKECDIHIR